MHGPFPAPVEELPPEPVELCPDCDGDGVTGTSENSPPCGTCQPEARAAWAETYTWPHHIPGKFSAADCTRDQAEEFVRKATAILERRKARRVLDGDSEGDSEDGPVARLEEATGLSGEELDEFVAFCRSKVRRSAASQSGARLRSLEDTDDGIDEAGWDRKVRELPDWDRCEGDGGSGGVDALDLSGPARAPFGREWRLGLVEDDDEPFVDHDERSDEEDERAREGLFGTHATRHPPAVATGSDPTPLPTAAGDRPAEEHEGAADHRGPAAPADPEVDGDQEMILSSGTLSETCAALASMGLMNPRKVVSIASVEEHAERWLGHEMETGPMTYRTKTTP